tara:strand:+ start:229 stop:342 length:114 start_codon:yes stop_codon:yes gene_type:complete
MVDHSNLLDKTIHRMKKVQTKKKQISLKGFTENKNGD